LNKCTSLDVFCQESCSCDSVSFANSANAATLLRETRGGPLVPSYLLHARYGIVSQIGTGGFGAVYQARDTLFSHKSGIFSSWLKPGDSTPPILVEHKKAGLWHL